MADKKVVLNKRRAARVRYNLKQRSDGKVRLSVFRSNKHIYAQLIDDSKGITLGSVSTLQQKKPGSNIAAAEKIGEEIAKAAKDKKIKEVVFDKGGYLYHGKIKALADAARKGGLKF